MTVEEVRTKFLDTCFNVLVKEPHINEGDRDFVYDEMEKVIMEQGGWNKVKQDIDKGIENGYSVDKQFEIMVKVMTQ